MSYTGEGGLPDIKTRLAALEAAPAGSAAWGGITGTLSAQTDLQTALNGKQAAGSYQPLATALTNTTAAFTTAQETKLAGITAGAVPDRWTWLKLASDSTNATVTLANVTGMSFTASANTTYIVDLLGAYQTSATTTGIAVALDIPSGSVIGFNLVSTSATAMGGTEQIADAATTGATTGVRASGVNTPIEARWVIAVGVTGGTIALQMRSEVAGTSAILKAALTVMGYRAI